MNKDIISSKENVENLTEELTNYHSNNQFLGLKNMGDILTLHLELKLGIKIL